MSCKSFSQCKFVPSAPVCFQIKTSFSLVVIVFHLSAALLLNISIRRCPPGVRPLTLLVLELHVLCGISHSGPFCESISKQIRTRSCGAAGLSCRAPAGFMLPAASSGYSSQAQPQVSFPSAL